MMGAGTLLATVGRAMAVVVCVLAALRMGVGVAAWRTAERLERPSYRVVSSLGGGVELREYSPYLIAETAVPRQPQGKPTATGFRTVAKYIFGSNKPRVKMAMTAPVRTSGTGENMAMTAPVRTESGAGSTKVSFVISSKYTRRTAPAPLDRSVSVKEVPRHFLAVRSFSGPPPSDQRVQKERERLLAAMEAKGLQPARRTEELVYGYHDPFMTPNFLRRNEVAVFVDPANVATA